VSQTRRRDLRAVDAGDRRDRVDLRVRLTCPWRSAATRRTIARSRFFLTSPGR